MQIADWQVSSDNCQNSIAGCALKYFLSKTHAAAGVSVQSIDAKICVWNFECAKSVTILHTCGCGRNVSDMPKSLVH